MLARLSEYRQYIKSIDLSTNSQRNEISRRSCTPIVNHQFFSRNHDRILVSALCNNFIYIAIVDSTVFLENSTALMKLAFKYGHLSSCLEYMDHTLQNIIEGWENIMMEMDIKLRSYASKV